MNMFKNKIVLLLAIACLGMATACSFSNSVVTAVDILVGAGEAVLPVLALTGTANPALTNYANQAGTAAEEITAELASSDTTPQKAQAIRTDLLNLVLPDITALPPADQSLFLAINSAVKTILNLFPATSSNIQLLHVTNIVHSKGFSKRDLQKLADLNKRARAIVLKTKK